MCATSHCHCVVCDVTCVCTMHSVRCHSLMCIYPVTHGISTISQCVVYFVTGIHSVFCTPSQCRLISILCILSQTICQCVTYSVKSQTMCQYLQLCVLLHTVCQCVVHFITDDVSVLFAFYHRRYVSAVCIP